MEREESSASIDSPNSYRAAGRADVSAGAKTETSSTTSPNAPVAGDMRFEESLPLVVRRFEQFKYCYQAHNYGAACDHFTIALRVDVGSAFRYFMTRASYALARTLQVTQSAEDVAAWLDPMLAQRPDIALLCDDDPSEVKRLLDLRQSNIDKGLPSVVLVTQPKSGSVSVGGIFNSGFNLPSFAYSLVNLEVMENWARDYVRGGACWVTHLLPKPRNVARLKRAGVSKIIVHVRDPRQSFLSWLHHKSRYLDEFPESAQRTLAMRSKAELLDELFDDYVSSIRWIEGWLDAEAEITVLFSTFEDFLQDREKFIKRYLEFYGGQAEHFSLDRAVTRQAGTDYHFRLGRSDEWRDVFPVAASKRLTAWLPESLRRRFNWPD